MNDRRRLLHSRTKRFSCRYVIDTLYIEHEIVQHPRVVAISRRFNHIKPIYCDRYTELFNRRSQNFRLQKTNPALILAQKYDHHVLAAPAELGIGGQHNYYFSHLLNCPYDCRYCFLQGMYRSANYVLFVNYEAFTAEIERLVTHHNREPVYFFSGYDSDSLALDAVTQFTETFVPLFRRYPTAYLELRTKSIHVKPLLAVEAVPNCIVAFSFTPQEISAQLEHKVPAVSARIAAMQKLQQHGWTVALRFDPLIFHANYKTHYQHLFSQIWSAIDGQKIHSVSLGSFRLPKTYFDNVEALYPDEPLFAQVMATPGRMTSYPTHIETELFQFCRDALSRYVQPEKVFFYND